jgi:hypothetical protein
VGAGAAGGAGVRHGRARARDGVLTDNPLVLTLPRRSSVVLLAFALVCALLLGSGAAVAASGGGGSNGGGGGGGGAKASSKSGSNSSGGQAATVPSPGSGPLSPGLSTPGTPTPTTATQTQTQSAVATTTTSGGGGSIGQTSILGIVIGAVVVIGGVCFYIFRDAGRRTAARGRRADAAAPSEKSVPGSKRVKPRKLSAQERKRRKRGRAPRRK